MFQFNKPRKLTPTEILELQWINQLAAQDRFRANWARGNTALVGKDFAKKLEVVATGMEMEKNRYTVQKLLELGYDKDDKCEMNIMTGKITKLKDGPPQS